ncbi:RNA polymerase sigma factor [Marinobacter sp. F4206]|uniref:RNA polymerase sigma factor n=1 Tax=Marinobacter sp. F4206 TaxID=2861777 RepID=UPI001C5E0D22|nr:RNA polymerase sigma factor [Marinobacter sp. F4206]MBW4935591.1 RNA polymerase sigma factor [Marinobacter sp. F4206]
MALIPFRLSKTRRFEALVQPHLEVMYRFAYRLAGQQQDAEDLVQDVVVKLYPRLDELESVDQLRPWLNRVLYRQFIDQVRRKGRQGDRPLSELMDGDSHADWMDSLESDDEGPDALLELERLGPVLDRVLTTLAPDQRTLVLLHDVDGWRQEDIAEVLDIPLGTVKSRLHRCRAMLRKKLQRELEPIPGSGRLGE